ncbi:DEAD/DEAH box helicase [Dictyobacter arantiisoli]|uniref:Helicase n=1 Tax=Dictyobacter arantiisoli TaxID=2014874 RepID=A0A5A5TFB1_9CHLR|nr:DEAD/DEAH box helicase [Dictyobacter arantiisoli]GCF09594.1 helicase [Dictyobacter arantiisoli]
MFVVHAFWDTLEEEGRIHLWAESSAMAAARSRTSRKRQNTVELPSHPFTLSSADLKALLPGILDSGEPARATLRLPTGKTGPLSSPELLLDEPLAPSSAVTLQSWQIDTLTYTVGQAFNLLLAYPQAQLAGVLPGSSLRFWQEVSYFAFDLITRECYVPGFQLSPSRDHGKACWRIHLGQAETARLHLLTKAMPPVCWSFLPPGTYDAGLIQNLILAFLNHCVNAYVRKALSADKRLAQLLSSASTQLAQRWLAALVSSQSTLEAQADVLVPFAEQLQRWLEPERVFSSNASFRTCFKLETPPENNPSLKDTWTLHFYLQSRDDPSLLVAAEQVWRERSSKLTLSKHAIQLPQELLLEDLGRAVRLFPLLEQGMKQARPTALLLNTEQAYHFLCESAPLLEERGFGVLVPSWWQKRGRIKARLRIQSPSGATISSGLMGMESIMNYDWQIAIGEQTLSLTAFQQLVNLKLPLINVRGEWVEFNPDDIKKALTLFDKNGRQREISLNDILHARLADEHTLSGGLAEEVEAQGWINDVLERLEQRIPLANIPVPVTFSGKLRCYQEKGVSWLTFLRQCGFGGCLADDMGMGKTIQIIASLLHEREGADSSSRQPALIICPMSVVGNWQHEVQRFAPSLSVMVHHGLERFTGSDFADEVRKHTLVITTYALALRDQEQLSEIQWDSIILDEAQNIKNEGARQTQAIKALRGNHRVALTGTPVENRLSELWSIMDFLNPGYLGSNTAFRKQFAWPIERSHDPERSAALRRLIQPFVLRRLKTDKDIIQDLPEKMEMKVYCNLTREQASLYEAVVQDMMEKIEHADGIERKGLILATLTRLKQVCNHPAQYLSDHSRLVARSGKLERLREMLEEVLSEGDKALIFTQYAEMGGLLRQYLQETLGVETLFLHGGTTKKQRDQLVQRFQEERRGVPLFILSLKAGGVGLNLTAANHVFHFDRWWNPAVENQATDRAFRIGQQKNVQVHKFICQGTMEERIDQLIEQKRALAEQIVGSGENWLTELSTDQLVELFTLDRAAIVE